MQAASETRRFMIRPLLERRRLTSRSRILCKSANGDMRDMLAHIYTRKYIYIYTSVLYAELSVFVIANMCASAQNVYAKCASN